MFWIKRQVKIAIAIVLSFIDRERAPLWRGNGRYLEHTSTKTEDLATISVPRGTTVWWYGAVYDEHKRLIEATACPDPTARVHSLINSPKRLPPKRVMPGRAVILTSLHADRYYHWMIDIVPKIDHFLREGLEVDYYLVCNETAFQREINRLMAIPEEKIIHPPPSDCHMQFDLVYAVTPASDHLGAYPHRIAVMQSLLLGSGPRPKPKRRIYVARGPSQTRRVLNEPELEASLQSIGFEIVHADALSVAQQARVFSEAELIVGPHGAAMTNLMFSAKGARLVEFMPRGYSFSGFQRICDINQISYRCIEVASHNGLSHDIVLSETLITAIAAASA